MVTFRFYVVSTVAFFLALSVGIVIGSALDERLVDGLRDRVENVQQNLDDTVETIDDKNSTIASLETYVDQSAPWAVDGTLEGSDTLVVAEDGVGSGTVEALLDQLRESGATTEGIIWLEPRWALEDDADVEALADALGVPASDPAELRELAWAELVEEASAATGAETPTTTTNPDTSNPDTSTPETSDSTDPVDSSPPPTVGSLLELATLAALDDAGFIRIQRVEPAARGELPPPTRVAFVGVTGTESDLPDPGRLVIDLAAVQAAAGVPTLVAEAHVERDDGPDRGALLAPIRDDAELSSEVATVDDLELIQGRVAAILALAQAGDGTVGHYGYGGDTSAIVPPWPGP